jgi:ElaB/YqjD/DUF883 family membrane-anchored ribosome-binding protein
MDRKKIRLNKLLLIILVMMGMMMVGSCTQNKESSKDDQTIKLSAEDYQKAKQEVQKDLEGVKQKADSKLEDLQHKSENASEEIKSNIHTAMEAIKTQKESVNEMLEKIDTGSQDDWEDVKPQAEKLVNDANSKIDLAADQAEEFFSSNNT